MDFERVDGDKNPELKRKYQVRGFPSLIYLDTYGNMIYNEGRGNFQQRIKELTSP